MLIEAVDQPIRYQWPEGEIRLKPGRPVFVPQDRGLKILKKCGSKVRTVQPDWLEAWRGLAQSTSGLEKTDDRFGPVMAALDHCDRAFENDDWGQFRQVAKEVKRLMNRGKV